MNSASTTTAASSINTQQQQMSSVLTMMPQHMQLMPHMQALQLHTTHTPPLMATAAISLTQPAIPAAALRLSSPAMSAQVVAMSPATPALSAISQPAMMRLGTAGSASVNTQAASPQLQRTAPISTHYTHRTKARPVRAVVAASSPSAPAATAAHVLQDVADVELSKRLQSRLATLGIGANMVKAEVRANAGADSANRTFTLTLSGKLSVSLGSLFNILIHAFLRQHTQIVSIERHITFTQQTTSPSLSAKDGKEPAATSSSSLERVIDSAPILALKVNHLAKLLSSASHTVVYTGDSLCQVAPVSSDADSSLTDLSVPHPPSVLTRWIRQGLIKHIINENTDGVFNPSKTSSSAKDASDKQSMSDEDEVSSVASSSSLNEDEDELGLTDEHLSELYGNKFKEVCSSPCCGASGMGSVYYRDFEVRQPRFGKNAVNAAESSSSSSSTPDQHLTGRLCSYCQSPLRDTLVDWNESLPRSQLQRSVTHSAQSDLSIIFGSSLHVTPTCDMPQLSSPSTPMIIVTPFVTAKDIEALEGGGILIRKEPAHVLAALEGKIQEMRESGLLPLASSTNATISANSNKHPAVQATIVRKSSTSSARSSSSSGNNNNNNNSLTSPSSNSVGTTPAARGSSSEASVHHRATALFKTWSKNSMQASVPTSHVATFKKTHAHLLQFAQRRGSPLGSSHGASPMGRPSMLRSATAPTKASMKAFKLSASLPPFPSLDEDSNNEDHDVPAASAPTRACTWSESHPALRMSSSSQVGQGSMTFLPMISQSPRSSENPLVTMDDATSASDLAASSILRVSSPIMIVSRGCSLNPPSWPLPSMSSNSEDVNMA